MEWIGPVAVVADHAPTAALVARLGDIPLVRMGMGFFAPPALQPLPSYRLWGEAPPAQRQAVEDAVLASVNTLAMGCGAQYASLAQALVPNLELLTCWPELDHYAGLRAEGAARCIGPERIRTASPPVHWPERRRPRALAYLSADCADLEPLLQALAQAELDTVAYVGGRGSEARPPAANGGLALRTELFDVATAMAQCDLLVCHAANGMTAAALAAGKPVLMWPLTAEQQLFAHRVELTGAGAVLGADLSAGAITRQVQAALEPQGLAARARALAARHAHEPDGLACGVQTIVEWLADSGRP